MGNNILMKWIYEIGTLCSRASLFWLQTYWYSSCKFTQNVDPKHFLGRIRTILDSVQIWSCFWVWWGKSAGVPNQTMALESFFGTIYTRSVGVANRISASLIQPWIKAWNMKSFAHQQISPLLFQENVGGCLCYIFHNKCMKLLKLLSKETKTGFDLSMRNFSMQWIDF